MLKTSIVKDTTESRLFKRRDEKSERKSIMQLRDFTTRLGFDDAFAARLAPYWPETPDTAPPEFLNDAFLRRWLPCLGDAPDLVPAVERTLAAVRREPALALWINLVIDFAYGVRPGPELAGFPEPVRLLGEDAGIPSLLAALGSLPRIEAAHRALGVPESCLAGCAGWIAGTVSIYRGAHGGRPGHDLRQIHWLKLSITGKLFRVGRFEFLIHRAPDWVPAVYRSRKDDRVVAFAQDGWKLTPEGYRSADNPAFPAARLDREGRLLTGTPVDFRTGRALPEPLTIDLDEYEPVFSAHDWVPSVHIPGGGDMRPELCRESLREAFGFFRRYFKKEIPAFVCCSWILNPDWMAELPQSNLAGFMRMVRLFPAPPDPKAGLFFVFGRDDGDPREYPADNSLRRAFRRVLESGRGLRSGGMLVFPGDLD